MRTKSKTAASMPVEERQWIAESAYYKSMARGFAPGYEESDWFEAKKEYEAMVGKSKNGLVMLR
ncbi:MAG: DUF2934 domain-containing protein [Gammaproteobacteria bacterium]